MLVVIDPRDDLEAESNTQELLLLAQSAGVEIVDEMHLHRCNPDPRFLIGSGNAEEVYLRVQDSGANVVIVGEDLSRNQQRNIEKAATVRVVDRTQLILDIFAQRAHSSEGKIQVELAQLKYLLPRLAGKGVAMSGMGGASAGIATRGPGETKLETDRRRLRRRISVLEDEMEEVIKHRGVQNKARRKLRVPAAALVGYTSAGKSTLLNLLAKSDVYTDEMLFATLDPTTRKVEFDGGAAILLSDTVGFLQRLPHHLIAAFRATLEEVTEADFLIHVVDAGHPFFERQRESVMEVLAQLDAREKPIVTVFNKSDTIRNQYQLRRLVATTPDSCYMSALTGEGVAYLIDLIENTVEKMRGRMELLLPYDRGDLLAFCHEHGRVIAIDHRPEGTYVRVEISPDLAGRLARYGV